MISHLRYVLSHKLTRHILDLAIYRVSTSLVELSSFTQNSQGYIFPFGGILWLGPTRSYGWNAIIHSFSWWCVRVFCTGCTGTSFNINQMIKWRFQYKPFHISSPNSQIGLKFPVDSTMIVHHFGDVWYILYIPSSLCRTAVSSIVRVLYGVGLPNEFEDITICRYPEGHTAI